MPTQPAPALELHQIRQNLDALGDCILDLQDRGEDTAANLLARHLVVRSSGFLERSLEIATKSYLTTKAGPQAASFGISYIDDRMFNPSSNRLVEYARRFDTVWATELEELLQADDDLLSRDINFLVSQRNLIAHGESDAITVRRSLELKDRVVEVAQWFSDKLLPTL